MKLRILSICCSIILLSSAAKAQYVAIPDSNFGKWLYNNGYSACMTGIGPNYQLDTSCGAVLVEDSIECSGKSIHSISGIRYFKRLKYLKCSNNPLFNLGTLPDSILHLECVADSLTSIQSFPAHATFIDCAANLLTSIPSIPATTTSLSCRYNHLTALPLLPSGLTALLCESNYLTILPVLPSGLILLNCQYNQITSLPNPLPPNLESLTVTFNPIGFLPPLPNSINNLDCCGCNLSALPTLPPNLQWLNCRYNSLNSLPSLPNSITNLDCGINQLTILPSLPTSLNLLDCINNQLVTIPTLPARLKYFQCQNNLLVSLPELPDSMINVYCSNNPTLMCLPELKHITHLDFAGTGVICVPSYGSVNNSNPLVSSLPLCNVFNGNSCHVAWNLTGAIYHDVNTNCAYDNSIDGRTKNIKILLYNNGILQEQYFVEDGFYTFNVNNIAGTYITELDTFETPFFVNCPAGGSYASIVSAIDTFFVGEDFALNCKPGFDIGAFEIVNHPCYNVRPGNVVPILINAGDFAGQYNTRCSTGISGMVQLIFSGPVTYGDTVLGALVPSSINGDTVTWIIADFSTINNLTAFNIKLKIDSNATLGSPVCVNLSATPTTGDNNPTNNSLHYCFNIVNALDPNTKEVYPTGNIDTTQEWLTYTVRFQNTGNAPALNVYILDTLSANVDESTIQMVSSSHQNITQVDGKVVRFNFPNINLPDSISDEPHSHGYVRYKVKPKHRLTYGTTISNTANIYFDLNPAVVTNTVTTTFAKDIDGIAPTRNTINELTFTIYPNPANNVLNIVADTKGSYTIRVLDVNGAEVKSQTGIGTTILDINNLSKGIYFVEVRSNGMVARKKVVKM